MVNEPELFTLQTACRLCGGQERETIIDLGWQPLANRLLLEPDEPYPTVPLAMVRCVACGLCQLSANVSPAAMFADYLYAASTVHGWPAHFSGLVHDLVRVGKLGVETKVLDLGSNDGVFLRACKQVGVENVIGVEPARALAAKANAQRLFTLPTYWNEAALQAVGPGTCDLVTAFNVYAHIPTWNGMPDIHYFTDLVVRALKPDGLFILEVQYLQDLIEKVFYENIYLEHVFYWSLNTLMKILRLHGLHVMGAQRIDAHGGSLRVYASPAMHVGLFWGSPDLIKEQERSALTPGALAGFARAAQQSQDRLRGRLLALRAAGKTIVLYGAPAKATTLLNALGLGMETIPYAVEDSALKVRKWIPVPSPIPIRHSSEIGSPDAILIGPANYAAQIREKTKHLGAEYIVPGEV